MPSVLYTGTSPLTFNVPESVERSCKGAIHLHPGRLVTVTLGEAREMAVKGVPFRMLTEGAVVEEAPTPEAEVVEDEPVIHAEPEPDSAPRPRKRR